MSSPTTYLINLDRSTARMDAAARQLAAFDIPFTRVSAVDGTQLDLNAVGAYDPVTAQRRLGRPLSAGEVGCYLSHLDCLRRFLSTDARTCLVLEDDFVAGPDAFGAVRSLRDLITTEGPDIQVVHLGQSPRKFWRKNKSLKTDGTQHDLLRAFYFPVLTTALLWSRPGAEAFMRDGSDIAYPIDLALQRCMCRSGKGFALNTPLFSQSDAASEIDNPASASRKKVKEGGRNLARRRIARLSRNNFWAFCHYAAQR